MFFLLIHSLIVAQTFGVLSNESVDNESTISTVSLSEEDPSGDEMPFKGASERLSITYVLGQVEKNNPQVFLSQLEEDQQRLEFWKSLTLLAPQIKAEGTWLNFGEPLEANLLGDGTQDLDCAPFEAFGFEDLCTSFSEPLLLREDKIFDGNVQIYYPISGLYSIYQGMKAQQSLLESKEFDTQKQVLAIQKQVSDLYFQMLHLEHVMDFTKQTHDGLLETKKRVSAMVGQGLVNPLDLQKIESGLLDIEQGQREAELGFLLLQDQMTFLIGTSFLPVELTDAQEAMLIQKAKEIQLYNSHPELQSLSKKQEAAHDGLKASTGQLFPNVVALGSIQETAGQGPMTPTQQQYIGMAVQGDFQWGKRVLHQRQQKLNVQKTQQGQKILQQGLELELSSLQQQLEVYLSKRLLLQKKVDVEIEALRQSKVLFDKNMLTTSELLEQERKVYDARLKRDEHERNIHSLAHRIVMTAGMPIINMEW